MGGGRAGGGGYHKPSAALCAALSDAGVNLDENISGAGDGAMEAAIEAIAKAVGVKKPIIHVAHG